MNGNSDSPKGDLRASDRSTADLRAAMLAAVQPVRSNLAMLNRQIAEIETELSELRAMRTDAERVLKVLDPDFDPRRGRPGPKRPGPRSTARVSAEKVNILDEWLRATFTPDDDLAVPLLRDRPDVPNGLNRLSIGYSLDALADDGRLRLDRMAQISKSGRASKIFRLIPAP